MKLTTLLITVFCLEISAAGYSQNVTISQTRAPLKRILQSISKQTGFQLLYNSDLLREAKPITIHRSNVSLKAALDEIFSTQPLIYSIYDKTILVTEREKALITELKANEVIQGKVIDVEGKPIYLASVAIKGSRQPVMTDHNGKFSIMVSRAGTPLVVSFVGYISQEVAASPGMTVVLSADVNKLNELVVVGYGNTKRKDLTGSIASVKTSEIKDAPFVSVDEALIGKAPGVQVTKADGSPGGAVRIRIRGGTSLLGTNDPLYVIDGIPIVVSNNYINAQSDIINPVESANFGEGPGNSVSGSFARGMNNLAGLNISDIETIDILKDASATAIYGSKAANGVVIITTKKGRQNTKAQINVNYYAGLTQPIKEQVLNAEQYKSTLREAASNYISQRSRVGSNLTSSADVQALNIINQPNFFGNYDTDWLGMILRNGFSQNADVAINGGGAGSRYYSSLSYTRQDGSIIGSDFSRISGKISLDNDLTSKFRVTTNLNYGYTNTNVTAGAYAQALTAPPTFPVLNPDGTFTKLGTLSSDYRGYQNPVALTKVTNLAKDYYLRGSFTGEYDLLKELKFKSTASVNLSAYNQVNYTPSFVEINGLRGRESSQGGLGSQSNSNSLSTFVENTLTWNKVFNDDHRFNVLAGTSWENNRTSFLSATGRGFPDDNYLNNLSSAATAVSVKGANPATQSALLSFYLRANYVLKDKYLFTFTGRSDASSKFAPSNQTGYFPSGAIAWRISQENFLKNITWIDEIKLRASAGKTGTQSIGDHLWRTLYAPDSYAGNNASVPSQLGNAGIKWESTYQEDLGLDFSLFKGRFGGTFGYYNKLTDGALLNLVPAPSSSYTSVIYNIAKIRNRGLELDLHGDFISGKAFSWSGSLNVSRNISKVLNIQGGPFSDPTDRNALNLGTSIVQEGEPLGLLYGRVSAGILKTPQEVEAYKKAFPYHIFFQPLVNVGDMAYKLDEAGFWKEEVIGKAAPKFFGGYTNIINYKRFSLISLFNYSYGGKLMYQKDVADMNVTGLSNRGIRVLDHYSADNENSKRPKYQLNETVFLSDENVYDATFLKLKSLTLSYAFHPELTDKLKMRSLSLYMTATNVFTITSYPGPDPEVSDDPGSVIGGGRDVSSYPTVKSYTIGVRFGF